MKVEYKITQAEWKAAAEAIKGTIAGATRGAFVELAAQVRSAARAEIASAGFSRRWQTGFSTFVFPRVPDFTTDLVMRGRHRIGFANIFERGGVIHPKNRKLLWVPLPSAPAKINGKPLTAAEFVRSVGPLHSINRPGKPPILAGYAVRPGRRVTIAQLRTGQRNARRLQERRTSGGRGRRPTRPISVPLFVGLSSVNIRDRLNVSAVYDKARADLPNLYVKHLAKLNQ